MRAAFLCGIEQLLMVLAWGQCAQTALRSVVGVILHVIFYCVNKLSARSEFSPVIHLARQNPPETFYWPASQAICYMRYALRHAGLFNLGTKILLGILNASVAVKQGMGTRIGFQSFVKGLKYELVVVASFPIAERLL